MDVPIASVEINGVVPCTFVEATLRPPFCTGLSPTAPTLISVDLTGTIPDVYALSKTCNNNLSHPVLPALVLTQSILLAFATCEYENF